MSDFGPALALLAIVGAIIGLGVWAKGDDGKRDEAGPNYDDWPT